MIVSSILNAFISFFESMFTFSIPQLTGIDSILTYIQLILSDGLNLYLFMIPSISKNLILIIISVHAIYYIYIFVMWIIKKIPLLNIS